MNNYEIIIQGGIQTLVETIINKCYYCDEVNSLCDHCCKDHITAWMEKEYIEQDSLEQLVEELRECAIGSPVCEYGHDCTYDHDSMQNFDCGTCSFRENNGLRCSKLFVVALADRIERLVSEND